MLLPPSEALQSLRIATDSIYIVFLHLAALDTKVLYVREKEVMCNNTNIGRVLFSYTYIFWVAVMWLNYS